MPAHIIDTIKCQTVHLFIHSLMLPSIIKGNTFQSIFRFTDNYINSTCADMVHVDVVNGTATIMFKGGELYHYTNVSRRAIAKFIIDEARSLGKFINNVCLAQRTKCSCIAEMPCTL